MAIFVLKRILTTIPVVAFVAFFVFALLYLTPGDPATMIAGDQASPDQIAQIRTTLGLDRPFLVQFLSWGWRVVHFDLGTAIFTGLPVTTLIQQRMVPTLSLMTLTLIISVSVAVPLGIAAAANVGSWVDRAVMAFATLGFSIPVFAVGYLVAYIFALKLKWFPSQGYVPFETDPGQWFQSLILPSITMAIVYVALIARIARAAILDTLSQDFIRTARAKGISRRRILYVHALRNAAVPIITVIGIGVAMLIGGAVITESVFAIPGLGRLTVDAILQRDYPIIQGVILFFSFIYVFINLVVDLIYVIVDPRIRY